MHFLAHMETQNARAPRGGRALNECLGTQSVGRTRAALVRLSELYSGLGPLGSSAKVVLSWRENVRVAGLYSKMCVSAGLKIVPC